MKYLISFLMVSILLGCSSAPIDETAKNREVAADGDEFAEIDFSKLKKVDVLGIPFGDTVLNEMRTERNTGVNNLDLQDDFVLRFVHLAAQFSADLEKMGMQACYEDRSGD